MESSLIIFSTKRLQKKKNLFRIHDVSRSGFNDWPFMTVHQWGEAPHGVWELEIHNKGRYMGKCDQLILR